MEEKKSLNDEDFERVLKFFRSSYNIIKKELETFTTCFNILSYEEYTQAFLEDIYENIKSDFNDSLIDCEVYLNQQKKRAWIKNGGLDDD